MACGGVFAAGDAREKTLIRELDLIIPAVPDNAGDGSLAARVRRRSRAPAASDAPRGLAPVVRDALGLDARAYPAAALTALGLGLPAKSWYCLAEAVALDVHTDHVRLAATPAPDAAEADALTDALAGLWADDGITVHAVGDGTLLVGWHDAPAARDASAAGVPPLAAVLGERPDAVLDDHRGLWRLLTEVQMLLHTHPINDARRARGVPPVDGLWLSEGGRAPSAWPDDAPAPPALLAGTAPLLAGLARLGGVRHLASPPAPDAAEGVTRALCVLETDAARDAWLDRAWRALRRGRLHRLRWWDAAGDGGELVRFDPWRVWRRRAT